MSLESQVDKIKENPIKFAQKTPAKELELILRQLAYLYYNDESPVTDETFDVLREYLKKKDPKNKFLNEVGAPVVKNRVPLPFPMPSLDKFKGEKNEIGKWTKKYKGPYVVSEKLDGTSLQLHKDEDGVLHLYTRGTDGEGTDCSNLIPFLLKDIDLDKLPEGISIRGELVLSKKDFIPLNEKHKFKSLPRQVTNSLVTSKKSLKFDVLEKCQFVTYSLLNPQMKKVEQLEILEKLGFTVANYEVLEDIDNEILSTMLQKRRKKSEFDIDGVVVFDDSKLYKNEKGKPKFAFAFKTIDTSTVLETMVVDVLWKKSKDGYFKPRAEIEPVIIHKTTVTYATAHHAKFVKENVIGPGAIIKINKSGEVIPKILQVIKPATSGEPKMPKEEYIWDETHTNIIVKHYDETDEEIAIAIIDNFFTVLKIKSIGTGIIKKLYDAGYKTILDVLDADEEDLVEIEGLGKTIVKKISKNIANAMAKMTLPAFMFASHTLGRGIGFKKFKLIVDEYPDILTNDWTAKQMKENIMSIKGFEEKTAVKIVKGWKKFIRFYEDVNDIYDIAHLEKVNQKKKKVGTKFDGMTIVFTGFRDAKLEEVIVTGGGKVATSVSGKTTIVIHKDGADKTTGKLQKATELGIQVMGQTEFKKKYL